MGPMTRLILGLAVLVGIMAGVAYGLPAHVIVSRSKSINVPESVVFPYLNDLHHFSDWSPWKQRDPDLKVTYSGPQQGKGAKVEWTSEKPSIGTGSIEIVDVVESPPNRNIELNLNLNGLEGTGAFAIGPEGSGSKVTWSFSSESGSSPLKRWKALMLDGFIGPEYDAGLDQLKEKVEAERRPVAPAIGLTPEGTPAAPGAAPVSGAPAAALLPGASPAPQGGAAPQGAALPSGQTAPADTGATAATPAQATQQPDATAPAAAEATPPPAAPAPTTVKKKKKKR